MGGRSSHHVASLLTTAGRVTPAQCQAPAALWRVMSLREGRGGYKTFARRQVPRGLSRFNIRHRRWTGRIKWVSLLAPS